jgi:hypothetical protein
MCCREVREQMSQAARELKGQLSEAQEQCRIGAGRERIAAAQVSSLRQQLAEAGERLAGARRQTELLQAAERRQVREMDTLLQTNALLKDRVMLLVKRAAAANEATKVSAVCSLYAYVYPQQQCKCNRWMCVDIPSPTADSGAGEGAD